MDWTPELKTFIAQHIDDDVNILLLSAHRYPGIDVPAAVDQISARKQIKSKLPEWFANPDIIMGGRVPAEQCSSETTAKYKRSLVIGVSLCDLTGGMGVDFYYMSRGLAKAIYTERQENLCDVTKHNLKSLGADNFEVRVGDGRMLNLPDVDTIYLDPARRATDGSRVYDLADCEPNVVTWHDELMKHCKRLIIKMSPMADITRVLHLIPTIKEFHILGVKNECKEVIAVCENDFDKKDISGKGYSNNEFDTNDFDQNDRNDRDVQITCVDFKTEQTIRFSYRMKEEESAEVKLCADLKKYIYEPDVTLMKAGAFKILCKKYDILKLDTNTHIYTSDNLLTDFPGKVFEVDENIPFSSKNLKTLKNNISKANIIARNFVMTADQLKSRSGIKDGGETFLVAVFAKCMGNILLKCHKAALLILVALLFGISSFARDNRHSQKEASLTQIISGIEETSPALWTKDMPFVCMKKSMSYILTPEVSEASTDTTNYVGSIWMFDSMVSEEDWMGRQTMALRFISPIGKAYRFSTERLMSQVADTAYHLVIPGLYPQKIYTDLDDALRSRTLYILVNDDRISGGDSVKMEKFVQVTIDSVSYGTEVAPIKVFYHYANSQNGYIETSLPNSRETATSSPITKYFSVKDPHEDYPNITDENWKAIQKSQLRIDMTREEARLSLGKPVRYETYNTKNGPAEIWYYSGGQVLEFWDSKLTRVGREK